MGANLSCQEKTWACEAVGEASLPLVLPHDCEQARIIKLCVNAARGDADAVQAMLRSGSVKAGDADYDKRTALHIAVAEGHLEVVQLLIANNADVNAKDRRGYTPMDEAIHAGHAEVRNALASAGGEAVMEVGDAAENLAADRASISREDSPRFISDALSLGCAAAAGSVQLLEDLVAGGVDVNAVDYDGRTALHVASARNHVEVVKCLIKMRVDVTCKDNFGRTAMNEAQRMRYEGVIETLEKEGGMKRENLPSTEAAAKDAPWGIPMAELTVGAELSATLKSIVFHGTWRGTKVVCKTARMLPTEDIEDPCSSATPAEKELVREIQLLSTMRHPDLVLFLGACVEHSPPFLITEFMEGGDLERYYRARSSQSGSPYRPPGRKLLRWTSAVARALAFLHEASRPIIHRDLKPLNLLLNSSEDLKVTDFGISKLMDTNVGNRRMSGGVGTWRYMAPEVVRCEDYTDRVDVYSFGLVVWFMATGMQPFVAELGQDPEEVLREFIKGSEPRPNARAMKCPSLLRTLTDECWHLDPERRPSALECTKRLASIAAGHREGPMEAMRSRLSG